MAMNRESEEKNGGDSLERTFGSLGCGRVCEPEALATESLRMMSEWTRLFRIYIGLKSIATHMPCGAVEMASTYEREVNPGCLLRH